MSALLQKLRGPSAQPRQSTTSTMSLLPPTSPAGVQMFLLEVIAFGEVYAVPVTKTTPATVVLRYVMEAAVSPEEAARLGNIEATLYYKEKPLPLDTLMGKLPKKAVLHLHSSLSTTAAVVRDRRQSAVSTLPHNRQRYADTTVTMQPVLKDGVGGSREGSNSTTGGVSSDGGSPSVERHGSAQEPFSVHPSMCETGSGGMMLFTPMMVPAVMMPAGGSVSGGNAAAAAPAMMMPYYCCMPVGAAGSGMRLLSAQGRTVSAPCLSASRRRDSAVEFANSYQFPLSENPLNIPADEAVRASSAETLLTAATSPRSAQTNLRSPPAAAAGRRATTLSEAHYVVVYLRLPRDRAAARMAAAAISGDSNVEMEEVTADEVPQDELMNATFSTVATTKSQVPRVYSYRRLRVRKDFPVGTLRELCAVEKHHRLHLAHREIEDEAKTFAELAVPPNAVFYFKATLMKAAGSTGRKSRTLTRERLQEHLEAGVAAAAERPLDSPARSPSHIDAARPSLDRSLPSPTATPTLDAMEPQFQDPRHRSGSAASSVSSSQSIHERISAFNEGAVRNPGCTEDAVAGDAGEGEEGALPSTPQRRGSPGRYVVEGRELTITSALATERARREAALAARQAAAEAEEAGYQPAASSLPVSPHRRFAGQPDVLPLEREEDVDVDAQSETTHDVPAPRQETARGEAAAAAEEGRQASPEPRPHAVFSASATVAADAKTEKTLGGKKKAFRWMRRSTSAKKGQEGLKQEAVKSLEEPQPNQPKQRKQPSSGAASRSSSAASSQQRGPHPARVSRVKKMYSKRVQKAADTSAAAVPSVSPDPEAPKGVTKNLPCAPLKPADIDRTAGATPAPALAHATSAGDGAAAVKPKGKKTKKGVKKAGTAAVVATPSALHSEAESAVSSRHSSRASSVASSLKASFKRLTRRKSKSGKETPSAASSRSASVSSAVKSTGTPRTASDDVLAALKAKSERLSRKKAKQAAARAAAADVGDTAAHKEQKSTNSAQPSPKAAEADSNSHPGGNAAAAPEAGEAAAAERPAAVKVRRGSGASAAAAAGGANGGNGGSASSYSERRRQSAEAVPRQPVSFLGSDPAKAASQRHFVSAAANTLEEGSATLGPAALSTTRVPSPRPSPRHSPSPKSILVSPSPEQLKRENASSGSNGSAGRTGMTEANVNSQERRTAANTTPESRVETPDYSVESTTSLNRLRITIKDPEDSSRFHYGVPVEPDCPVGALREWITAMQRPATTAGKTPPSLRDVDRYGVFAGDTYLRDENHVTFGDVTAGRNDVIFSIRSRI